VIVLKSDQEIDAMKASCQLAAQCLVMIQPHVKPGITTLELNDLCHEFITSHGAIAAPLNYKGFPKSVCTSVNEVVCHGIPNARQILKDGDIINVDVTTILAEYHGDTSKTFLVGQGHKPVVAKIVKCAEEAMYAGISAVRAGGRIGDIGAAIMERCDRDGFSVVREFVGHGIGKGFHEDPQVPHYGLRGKGARLEPGMTFTIEPMVNEGHWKTKVLGDGWTAVTIDRKLSAQFEHTIAIRSDGSVEILTVPK
jgi:methionyl aminopeptidase